MKRTDSDWKRWGTNSPYYGVLSLDRFRPENLDDEAMESFFASGEVHVNSVFSQIESMIGESFRPRSSLDFGCGVGRLSIPIAKRSGHTIAVDVSQAMLEETARNCAARHIDNIEFAISTDALSGIPAEIDFVHSFIVLQHIAAQRGQHIIAGLARRVSQDGFLALQFYSRCNSPWFVRTLVKGRYVFPPLHWLRNLMKSRPLFEQAMQLHVYDLSKILGMLRTLGFPEVQLNLDTEAGGQFESVFLLAQRTHRQPSILNPLA